ncbi:MAG: type I-E CRISPR-associated protein Cas6/Cse3/CasE [Acidaminococcales bacterium]|jgi:CRISPR system Cascade subunit CasE|nr:type I-E CRISPR-associated protein Cas6/Cse3/CasE [Acidaminococcales bacterium]
MMYISRIELNCRRRETGYLLASPQRLHAALAGSFPADGADGKKRMLWRIDKLGSALYIITQSQQKPDFTHIVEKCGWPGAKQQWLTKEYGPFLERLQTGQAWQFRLRANPVRSLLRTEAGKGDERAKARGQLSALADAEKQKKWLCEKGLRHGFYFLTKKDEPQNIEVVQKEIKEFYRFDPAANERKTVTINMVTFEGILLIAEREKFTAAMLNGIGRAKAYGCGLLTLARLP